MLAAVLLLSACTAPDDKPDDTAIDTSVCWTDLATGDAVAVASGFADGTEGVAFVGGRLFVSAAGVGIVEVGADGTLTTLVALDHALGLAPANGLLVADPGEFTFDGSGDDGRLLLVDVGTGAVHEVATGLANPNFVAATPWDDLLVSDDTNPRIDAVDELREVTTWLDTVESPNGMALAPDGRALYVVSTFLPDPPLWRVPVAEDGTPGVPAPIVTFDTGSAPDGVAVAADGSVWVALNLANEIVRVDPATGDVETLTTAVTTPASLAYGTGADFDPCSLYVTELYGDTVWRVATGVPAPPMILPALTFEP